MRQSRARPRPPGPVTSRARRVPRARSGVAGRDSSFLGRGQGGRQAAGSGQGVCLDRRQACLYVCLEACSQAYRVFVEILIHQQHFPFHDMAMSQARDRGQAGCGQGACFEMSPYKLVCKSVCLSDHKRVYVSASVYALTFKDVHAKK